jgi:hypothetical protein
MQTSTQSVPASVQPPADPKLTMRHEDRAYQVVTVAAILLLLGSLWVF